MKRFFDGCSRLKWLGLQAGVYMVVQSLLRLLLLLSAAGAASWGVQDLLCTFGLGLVYDAVACAFFCLPLAFVLLLLPARWLGAVWGGRLLVSLLMCMNLALLFTAVAQFLFWQEFHTNFNFIAVDYLIYTTEMLLNIGQTFPVHIILPVLLLAAALLTWAEGRVLPRTFRPQHWYCCGPYLLLAAAVPAAGSAMTHDQWRESVSQNRYNVELAGNGPYGFVHAFFFNELDYHQFYHEEGRSEVLANLRSQLQAEGVIWDVQGVARQVSNLSPLSGKRPNVVLITVESLSTDFCGAFGAEKSWTPELDKLADDSYIYTRMYATGTRTVRGLEALSLSVPPTPGQSILRRPDNQGLATLGAVFRKEGYETEFVYGGYGYFDNMNEFFGGNGYAIKDRAYIPDEEAFFSTAWGVADEILFSQVLKSLDEHAAAEKPAFEMVMTTSNHSPYTFPEGRVDDSLQGVREGACRYTDWAIADFLQRAAERPWFDNTVFVIVADHQAKAAGKTELPVNKYHIPCLIYAPGLVQPGQCDRLLSQIDLPPTLLGVLGISYDSRFLGRDIVKVPAGQERAFISTYQSLGYIEGDYLVVLNPGREVHNYRIDDWEQGVYTYESFDKDRVSRATAWYQGASDLYHSGALRAP